MAQKNQTENRLKCGGCGTEFDLNKNKFGCPLCGFGKNFISCRSSEFQNEQIINSVYSKHMTIPPDLELNRANVNSDKETRTWGSWPMFNDFFAPKLITRVLAWKLYEEKSETVLLSLLMSDVIKVIKENELSKYKGFPNLDKDPKGERLVNHFLSTFTKMGLTIVKPFDSDVKDVWKEEWKKIRVSLSKKGLEFAQLQNPVFDDHLTDQVLSEDEKIWIINYLIEIDKKDYKEYSVLKEVYNFLKAGNNGNKDLWNWFVNNEKYRNYIPERSKSARENPEIFQKQIWNYARSFSTAKISLLRELGVIENKRNNYSIVGEF